MTVIPTGTEIEITEIQGKWGKTTYDGYEGYCGLSYTTLISPAEEPKVEIPVSTTTSGTDSWTSSAPDDTYNKGYYTVTTNLRLRSQPNTSDSSEKLAIMPGGTKIQITEISNGWGKTIYSQLVGWCSLEYCEFEGSYLESTEIYAPSIVGVVGEEADISNLSVNMKYSDGSVYSVKNGISVEYTIPTAPGIVTAKAKYAGVEYKFSILYTENCIVKTRDNATYVVVNEGVSSAEVFGSDSVTIVTGGTYEIEGISFTTVSSGDVDGNGEINATDYLRIKQAFLGNHTFEEAEELAADMNNDGEVNTTDYLLIKTIFLN